MPRIQPHKNMLGEQIGELKGKIAGQRVLDVEGPTMETSVSIEGSFRGTQVKQHLTYIAKPVSPGGTSRESKRSNDSWRIRNGRLYW